MKHAQSLSEVSDWEDRYKKIIEIGKQHQGLPAEEQDDDLLVKGCQSRVWLKAELLEAHQVRFRSDSDALITKGLAAIVCDFFSNQTPEEILYGDPTFMKELGLESHLSPSRANGLASMIKQIKYYAAAYDHLVKSKV